MGKKVGLFAAFAVILVILVILIVDRNVKLQELDKQAAQKYSEKETLILEVEKLNAELNCELDEETIKRIAREKLNLRERGDVAFATDLPN